MQALRRSFLNSIGALTGAAQRVGAAGSGSVDVALANAPLAAAAALAGRTSTSSGSCASAWARWRSTAAAAAAPAPAESPFKEYTSAPALTRHQVLKRLLKPENSGRKKFKRNWQKQLQIKWNAQERKANEAAARRRQHEKRQQLFKQRAEWAAERAQQAV